MNEYELVVEITEYWFDRFPPVLVLYKDLINELGARGLFIELLDNEFVASKKLSRKDLIDLKFHLYEYLHTGGHLSNVKDVDFDKLSNQLNTSIELIQAIYLTVIGSFGRFDDDTIIKFFNLGTKNFPINFCKAVTIALYLDEDDRIVWNGETFTELEVKRIMALPVKI